MAADEGDIVDGCCADRISDLPDHLLHRILLRLPSTAAAARTSVLSRRWRRVWPHLPELALRYRHDEPAPASSRERVDAALAACAAPVLQRLQIEITRPSDPAFAADAAAAHVSSWLRFASRRVAGELRLTLPCRSRIAKHEEAMLLPLGERLTAISLTYLGHVLRFQLLHGAGAGAFTALATLAIIHARVDGRELEDAVSSRCPRLKELVLEHISLLQPRGSGDPVLSIRSDSLERLRVAYLSWRCCCLYVDAPELQALSLRRYVWCDDAYIIAPKLSEMQCGRQQERCYGPCRHYLEEAGRHIRRLEMAIDSRAAAQPLMGCFDATDELTLNIFVSEGVEEYEIFLEDTNKLPKCEVLVVRFSEMVHDFQPIILHLLQKCIGIRKLVVRLGAPKSGYPCKLSSCPCGLLNNRETKGIILDSLQEVEVEEGGEADDRLELASLLCRCSATFQKKVSITISEDKLNCTYMSRKIDTVVPPNDRVEVAIR